MSNIHLISKYGLTDIGISFCFIAHNITYQIVYDLEVDGCCSLSFNHKDNRTIISEKISGCVSNIIYASFPSGYNELELLFTISKPNVSILIKNFILTIHGKVIPMTIRFLNKKDMDIYMNNCIISNDFLLSKKKLDISHHKKNEDFCFVIGNGPSLKTINLDKLKKYTTICCNYFLEESTFQPTFLCGADPNFLINKILNDFQFDNKNMLETSKTIHIIYPYILLKLLYNSNMTPKEHYLTDIRYKTKYFKDTTIPKKIIELFNKCLYKNKNIFLVKSIPIELTKELNETIDKDLIKVNTHYINSYYNIIPILSLELARELGFKRIYLLGCDGKNFYRHFYDEHSTQETDTYYQEQTLNGYKRRKYEFEGDGIRIINCCSDSKYDFFEKLPKFNDLLNNFSFEEIDKFIISKKL